MSARLKKLRRMQTKLLLTVKRKLSRRSKLHRPIETRPLPRLIKKKTKH